MIRYSLTCANDHGFEVWFRGSEDFEAQRAGGQIQCPSCGTTAVDKSLMAPAVSTGRARAENQKARYARMREAMRQLKQQIIDKAEYVGPRFAEEARRIHEGDSEDRGIYGEAAADEVSSLLEDGIDVFPLPVLPEEHN